MATNDAVNIKDSGIVSYDGAGTFSALANPLIVANGGTGDASLTAYAVLTGGTTSTGNIQSIASVGTLNQVLTSNGAGALPTFQANATGGYVLAINCLTGNPADSTTYFICQGQALTAVTAAGTSSSRLYIPRAGTITAAYGGVTVQGTLGSASNSTVIIRLNNTTDTNISTTVATTATSNAFSNSGLSISVSAGDYVEIKFTGPAWATNPTTVGLSVSLLIT